MYIYIYMYMYIFVYIRNYVCIYIYFMCICVGGKYIFTLINILGPFFSLTGTHHIFVTLFNIT